MKSGVLLVANYSNKTGYAWNNIYRLFGEIAKSISPLGVDVYISFADIIYPLDNFDPALSINYFKYEPADRSFKNTMQLLRFIKKNNIRYVYLTDHNALDLFYVLLRFSGVKKIVVHNRISVSDPCPAAYEKGLKGMIKCLLGRWDLICADKVYAVSDFVRNRLLQKNRLPERRVVKILNGIDVQRFSPVGDKAYNDGHVHIFVGGRATLHKGIHVLIEAAADLQNITNTPFLIRYAGDGPDIGYLKKLVAERGITEHFLFLGELSSTQDEVVNADIIVVPSIWGDACPSAVSEALASGVPLITTSVGGVPEIVGDYKNAIMIPPDDPDCLCQALASLIDSSELREEIGRNGRRRAIQALDESSYHQVVIKQLLDDFCIS